MLYDEMFFSEYKTNEGFLSSKTWCFSVAEYIATHHLSVDKILLLARTVYAANGTPSDRAPSRACGL